MPGVPALNKAIAGKIKYCYDTDVCPETEVTVMSGATQGLFAAIHAVIRDGDEAIVFDPAYDSYEPAVTLAGGTCKHIALVVSDEQPDFHIDWERLKDSINDRTRLIISNFPHNPTSVILTAADLDTLADVVRDTSVYLLSDEVYEHIIFDGAADVSLLKNDELLQRTFVFSSFGKT